VKDDGQEIKYMLRTNFLNGIYASGVARFITLFSRENGFLITEN